MQPLHVVTSCTGGGEGNQTSQRNLEYFRCWTTNHRCIEHRVTFLIAALLMAVLHSARRKTAVNHWHVLKIHYTHLQEGYSPIFKESKTNKSIAAKCWQTQRNNWLLQTNKNSQNRRCNMNELQQLRSSSCNYIIWTAGGSSEPQTITVTGNLTQKKKLKHLQSQNATRRNTLTKAFCLNGSDA